MNTKSKTTQIEKPGKLNIRVEMEGEMLERFESVKAVLGIQSGTDVFRYLVSDYYHRVDGSSKTSSKDNGKAAGGV